MSRRPPIAPDKPPDAGYTARAVTAGTDPAGTQSCTGRRKTSRAGRWGSKATDGRADIVNYQIRANQFQDQERTAGSLKLSFARVTGSINGRMSLKNCECRGQKRQTRRYTDAVEPKRT